MKAGKGPSGPTGRTVKRLFAVSSNRCAFRRCTTPLVQGNTVVGKICHIKAANPGGPRYDPEQTEAERHAFENLILMCGVHHDIIDDEEELYTVEYLLRRKTEHEAAASPIEDGAAERAAQLLIQQTVSSSGQSGGITAHTVNANFFQTFATEDPNAGPPNWSFHDLFHYLRPNVSAIGPTEIWDEVGGDVLDKLSSRQLHAWGREVARDRARTRHNLGLVVSDYWRTATLNYVFLLDGHDRDVHASQSVPSNLPDLADLHVNHEAAIRLWPHPMRGRWHTKSFTLMARYMGPHNPDQTTLGCNSIALYDANVETVSDGNGTSPYQRVVTPAYILATGLDTAFVRSLEWQPQVLSFTDPETGVEQALYLTGAVDTSSLSGRAKFFLEPQAAIAAQPISPDAIAQANAYFGNQLNHFFANIDPITVLWRGPKLILQILPTSGLDTGRTIDRRAPQQISHLFAPDGHQGIDGRPRQDGWVWFQPRQPVENFPIGLSWWQSRLNWNGYVEIIETLDRPNEIDRVELIQGYQLERHIVQTLDRVADGLQQLNVRSAVVLRITLSGILGARITKSTPGGTPGFDTGMVVTDPIGLVQMAKPLGQALRPALDSIWRAAGWPDGSPSYQRGDWDGYSNTHLYR